MHPSGGIALRALVALAVPLLLVGNMLWVVAQPWLVTALYALPGMPLAAPGVSADAQVDLAKAGVRAIQPAGEGAGSLDAARLPDGAPAFTPREIAHMRDVESVVDAFIAAWAVAAVLLVAVFVLAHRRGAGTAPWRGLGDGGLVTVALVGLLGVGMLLSFDAFFVAFHGVFFEGDSWRFSSDATLLKLYPERFWSLSGGLAVALILAQALLLVVFVRRRPRAMAPSRSRSAPRPV